jgi:hypothetical protein
MRARKDVPVAKIVEVTPNGLRRNVKTRGERIDFHTTHRPSEGQDIILPTIQRRQGHKTPKEVTRWPVAPRLA